MLGCEPYPVNAETTSTDMTDVRECRGIVARATGTVSSSARSEARTGRRNVARSVETRCEVQSTVARATIKSTSKRERRVCITRDAERRGAECGTMWSLKLQVERKMHATRLFVQRSSDGDVGQWQEPLIRARAAREQRSSEATPTDAPPIEPKEPMLWARQASTSAEPSGREQTLGSRAKPVDRELNPWIES